MLAAVEFVRIFAPTCVSQRYILPDVAPDESVNAMYLPSGVIELANWPAVVSAYVVADCLFRTKRFSLPASNPGARTLAVLRKRTIRPSALIAGPWEFPFPGAVPSLL